MGAKDSQLNYQEQKICIKITCREQIPAIKLLWEKMQLAAYTWSKIPAMKLLGAKTCIKLLRAKNLQLNHWEQITCN